MLGKLDDRSKGHIAGLVPLVLSATVDLRGRSLQPPNMRMMCVALGALGWAVACGDDSPSQTRGDTDAGSGSEPSSATPQADGGSPQSCDDFNADSSASSDSLTTADAAPPNVNTSDAPTPVCVDDCTADSVRCQLESDQWSVRRCVVAQETGCTRWLELDDCDGSCLTDMVPGACDPTGPNARCSDSGLVVCDADFTGCPVWQRPSSDMMTRGDVELDDDATTFSGYGTLKVTLTGGTNTDQLVACLDDARERPSSNTQLAVTDVTPIGNNEFELRLARYQLPVAYELTVAVGMPPAVRTTVLAPDIRSRVAFVSATSGNGALASWTPAEDTPLEAADSVCQMEAERAGLSGSFRAFLSTADEHDALCRLSEGGGLVTDECGGNSPQGDAPFLNLDGLPIAYGMQDIAQGLWRVPVGYNVEGIQLSSSGPTMWTGSRSNATAAGYDCDKWTSASAEAFGDVAASPGTETVNSRFTLGCDEELSLLCFSVQSDAWPLPHVHERAGKLAYITETEPNITLTDADAACAQSAPKETSSVVAWFSDADSDAICRLIGGSGRIAENCNQTSIDWSIGPWVRPDGYVVAERLEDLTQGLLAPISLGPDGSFAAPGGAEIVRTDTYSTGAAVVAAGQCITGSRNSTSTAWTQSATRSCASFVNSRTFVYCFEQ